MQVMHDVNNYISMPYKMAAAALTIQLANDVTVTICITENAHNEYKNTIHREQNYK